MLRFNPENSPHYRVDPLTGDRVLVSPHRAKRPWQGAIERSPAIERVRHDPNCPLCPRVTRANGEVNPDYQGTFVFENDFPALLDSEPPRPSGERGQGVRGDAPCDDQAPQNPFPNSGWGKGRDRGYPENPFQTIQVEGECRVICLSPRHDLTLAEFEIPDLERVVKLWKDQTEELLGKWEWVQIFENKGEMMGCSNPHPHGQIWATSVLPSRIETMAERQRIWLQTNGTPLLAEVQERERAEGLRVVESNDEWLAIVPFWATWPFETMILPRRFVGRLTDLTAREEQSLAHLLSRLLKRLDGLFKTSFPYSFGWRQEPASGPPGWGLHGAIYPPLLRSASVRKFMVGYELLSGPQRDLTPEQAAERLRAVTV